MKLNGLYVDVYKGQIRTPKSEVSKEKAEQILDLMNNFATGFYILLVENYDQFKETVKLIDPSITLGTMKSDFTKFTPQTKKD